MNNAIEIKGLDVALCGFKLKNINMEMKSYYQTILLNQVTANTLTHL